MIDVKTLKAISSRPFSYESIDFASINGQPDVAKLYKAINWSNFDFLSLRNSEDPENQTQLIRWELVNLAKALSNPSFSIEEVDWSQVNASSTAVNSYKVINWTSVDWSLLSESTLNNLNWQLVDLREASRSTSFTLDKVDWDAVNSSRSASKAYRAIEWASINWNNLEQDTREALDWGLVDISKAKLGAGFSVKLVQWDEVNQSRAAAKAYKAIDWKSVDADTLNQLSDINRQLLPKGQISSPGGGSTPPNPRGIALDFQKLRSTLLAAKQGTIDNDSLDRDGSSSQFTRFSSTYQYQLDSSGRPLVVKETADIDFSQTSNGETISDTSQDVYFYQYSYGQAGFSLAKFRNDYDYSNNNGITFDELKRSPVLEKITTIQAYGQRGIALEELNFRTDGVPIGIATFFEPGTQLAGGGAVTRSYSSPAGEYQDPLAEYYINLFLGEGLSESVITKTTNSSQGKVTTVESKPGSPFQGSLKYALTSDSYGFEAQVFDFPILNQDEVGINTQGKLYSGGFETFLNWRAQDEIMFNESSLFTNLAEFQFLPEGDAWGRGSSQAVPRPELIKNYSIDDKYPLDFTRNFKFDPLTGQYISGQATTFDQNLTGIDQYSYRASENFTANYASAGSNGLVWSENAEILAAMNQELNAALGRFSLWAADQPALFTSYWS